MALGEHLGAPALGLVQRPRQVRQVLATREQDRAVDAEALDHLDLERDRARHVACVAGDLAVALERVHVAEVDAAAVDLHGADEDRAGAHRVDVHVAVGLVALQLLGREREAVRRADQERAEVARVVRVGDRRRRRRAELAQERPQPRGDADEVVRREQQDRVLDGVVGQLRDARGVVRHPLGLLLADRDADRVRRVERDRVAVGERERRCVGAAARAADRLRADALDARLRPLGAAARAHRRAVRIAVEAPLHRLVVARRRGHRGDLDVADADRDRVADPGALDRDRLVDLVAAADRRRDHRPPAAGRAVDHDVAAVGDRAEHRHLGAEQSVGERVDEHGLAGGADAGSSMAMVQAPLIGPAPPATGISRATSSPGLQRGRRARRACRRRPAAPTGSAGASSG